jgi:hypothetical protein
VSFHGYARAAWRGASEADKNIMGGTVAERHL